MTECAVTSCALTYLGEEVAQVDEWTPDRDIICGDGDGFQVWLLVVVLRLNNLLDSAQHLRLLTLVVK